MSIGSKIRDERLKKKLSLRRVAKAAGVTPSFLSQVERDLASPSIGTLKRITDALGMSVGQLFNGGGSDDEGVVRGSSRKRLIHTVDGRQVEHQLLAPSASGKMEPLMLLLPPGARTATHPYSHEGEEFGYVIKGKITCVVDDEIHVLGEGDSIYFKSSRPHVLKNDSDTETVCIWVSTPPRNRW